jgi:hypothetical protein
MDLVFASIILQALILCGLLYLIARHEADFEFAKVAMVVAAITLGNFMIEKMLTPRIGLFSLGAEFTFVVLMIWKFCWLRWWKALVVSLLFVAVQVGMTFGLAMVVQKVDESVDDAGGTVVEQADENTKEAMKIFREMMDSNP